MRRDWTSDELLLAFNQYCKTPFGRLHQRNPVIIALAAAIGRTPGALAMKLVNFASFDPTHQDRNVSGLRNASRGDREIFDEFTANWEELAFQSEQALNRIGEITTDIGSDEAEFVMPEGPTERERLTRVRIVQRFFHDAVIASYDGRCAMCGISVVELLNASHIIPWGRNVERRADPTNGLSLCGLHDRAFDRGLVTVTNELRIEVSATLHIPNPPELHRVGLIALDGEPIILPRRFHPDPAALEYHRQHFYRGRKPGL